MKDTVIRVAVNFNNVYEWGRGFKDAEAANKWDSFWKNLDVHVCPIFWQYCPPKESYSCGHLVSNAGSFYVHPMDMDTVLKTSSNGLRSELLELEKICKGAAEAVGGTAEVVLTEAVEVEFTRIRQLSQVYRP